jgi:hypothetical protein
MTGSEDARPPTEGRQNRDGGADGDGPLARCRGDESECVADGKSDLKRQKRQEGPSGPKAVRLWGLQLPQLVCLNFRTEMHCMLRRHGRYASECGSWAVPACTWYGLAVASCNPCHGARNRRGTCMIIPTRRPNKGKDGLPRASCLPRLAVPEPVIDEVRRYLLLHLAAAGQTEPRKTCQSLWPVAPAGPPSPLASVSVLRL